MQSKCSQRAVKMQPKCSQNAVKMQSKCTQNAVKMQSKYRQNSVKTSVKIQSVLGLLIDWKIFSLVYRKHWAVFLECFVENRVHYWFPQRKLNKRSTRKLCHNNQGRKSKFENVYATKHFGFLFSVAYARHKIVQLLVKVEFLKNFPFVA